MGKTIQSLQQTEGISEDFWYITAQQGDPAEQAYKNTFGNLRDFLFQTGPQDPMVKGLYSKAPSLWRSPTEDTRLVFYKTASHPWNTIPFMHFSWLIAFETPAGQSAPVPFETPSYPGIMLRNRLDPSERVAISGSFRLLSKPEGAQTVFLIGPDDYMIKNEGASFKWDYFDWLEAPSGVFSSTKTDTTQFADVNLAELYVNSETTGVFGPIHSKEVRTSKITLFNTADSESQTERENITFDSDVLMKGLTVTNLEESTVREGQIICNSISTNGFAATRIYSDSIYNTVGKRAIQFHPTGTVEFPQNTVFITDFPYNNIGAYRTRFLSYNVNEPGYASGLYEIREDSSNLYITVPGIYLVTLTLRFNTSVSKPFKENESIGVSCWREGTKIGGESRLFKGTYPYTTFTFNCAWMVTVPNDGRIPRIRIQGEVNRPSSSYISSGTGNIGIALINGFLES